MNLNSPENDKVNKHIDKISNKISEGYNRRVNFGKNVRNGVKFLISCLFILPKDLVQYFKNKIDK